MNKTLRVSKELELPAQFVTHRNALLGMSGSGKSNASTVIAEEMFRLQLPWLLIDPKGDAFGIRSNRDGNGPGLDVPIFGGTHGDLPLAPRAGKLMGELVAAGKITGIFDLSGFDTDAEKARFMADFGRALFRNRTTPIHVFCDECHEYMPQPGAGGRLEGPAAECVGVWKKIAVQGRQKGIGFTLASQRSAHVNKTCLYTCETLIAMRTMGKHDRKAIEDWADSMGEAKELRAALPQLGDGEAYIFSPHRLRIAKRVLFRRRETYDSGRTPEVGETVVAPKLAYLDLKALRAELAALDQVEEDGDDADLLVAENARLRARVAELEARPPAPMVSEEQIARLEAAAQQLHTTGIAALEAARGVMAALPSASQREPQQLPVALRRDVPESAPNVAPRDAKSNGRIAGDLTIAPVPPAMPAGNGSLPKVERLILLALAQHAGKPMTRDRLALFVGYHANSKSFSNGLGALRGRGSVDDLAITKQGRSELGPFEPLPTGRALLEWYCTYKLGGPEAKIMRAIASSRGELTRDELASRVDYHPNSKSFANGLGRLRGLGLVDGLRLSEELR